MDPGDSEQAAVRNELAGTGPFELWDDVRRERSKWFSGAGHRSSDKIIVEIRQTFRSPNPHLVVRFAGLLLFGLGLGYLALLLLVYALQGRLLYFPSREIEHTPASVGLEYEEVWLRAEDGVRLQAWFVPADSALGTVLFFHGNAGNLSHRLATLEMSNHLGWNTLILSYRGYGRSEGHPTERGTYLDAEAAWRHLTDEREIPPEKIALFGRSLGGAVAGWLAARYAPGALVLESTFTSVSDLAAEVYPFLPARLLVRYRYPTLERLKSVRCPVLVVHSPEDEMIPFRHGYRLWQAAGEPKDLLRLRGTHNEGFVLSGEDYQRGLQNFLVRAIR